MKKTSIKSISIFCIIFALALTASAQGTSSVHGPKKKKAATTAVKSTKKTATSSPISTAKKVDLGLSVYWAGYNVGATSPEQAGDYYDWAETYDKEGSFYGKEMDDISGNPTYDAARAHWGGSWRMPTKREAEELVKKCKWRKTTYKGVLGYKVTGPNGNSIFLAMGGVKYVNSNEIHGYGKYGVIWTSTPDVDTCAFSIYFSIYGGMEVQLESRLRGEEGDNVRAVMSK